jgi:oxygen-dependent protoporphyrinogen oxidase
MSPRKLWPVLSSPLLSVAGKLRLLMEPLAGRARPAAGGTEALHDESVADFARRRVGREAFERLVQPLVAGIYTADPERLSMAATLPQFLELEHSHGSLLRGTLGRSRNDDAQAASGARYGLFVTPGKGLGSLVRALTERLPHDVVQLNTVVVDIESHSDQWLLHTSATDERSAPQISHSFDAVIVALPAHAAAAIMQSFDAELASELAAIPYAGCAVVSFGFDRRQISHRLDGFGFVVPEVESRPIIAGSFASLKFAGRAPGDHVLIRAFLGGALRPELLERSDAELIGIAQQELTELLGICGEPLVTDVARWPRSMPQYHVGHLARVDRIEQLMATHPGLELAGNAYRGVGIPQCIASGQAAAARIAAKWTNASAG